MRRPLAVLLTAFLPCLAACRAPGGSAASSRAANPPASPVGETAAATPIGPSLPWCVVDDALLPEDFVPVITNGRIVATCSPRCADSVRRDPGHFAVEVDRRAIELQMRDYPLDRCVVSGRPLGSDAIAALAGPVLVRLCGDACRPAFDADPRVYLAHLATARSAAYGEVEFDADSLDAEQRRRWVEIQRPELPSSLCASCGVQPTDGEEARELLLRGTLVRVCSQGCAERARTLQNEVVAAVQRAAFERQKRTYPLGTCPVTGQELGPHASSAMVGLLLVRVCSPGCAAKLPLARESVASLLATARSKASSRAAERHVEPRTAPTPTAGNR